MAHTALPLTFGIEIETIFAFHEDRLLEILKKYSCSTIVKNHSPQNEHDLRHAAYQEYHYPYRSWGIRANDEHEDTVTPNVVDANGVYRAYKDEPLQVVRNIIGDLPGFENVSCHYRYDKQDTYAGWSIQSDATLFGLTNDSLVERLGDRVCCLDSAEQWDSWGVELVSPPYSNLELLHRDTSALLNRIKGDARSNFGTMIDAEACCGFHVHVGLPNNEKFSITTIQHLAYLLIVFEDKISLLHAPSRRDITSASCIETRTNREEFSNQGFDIKLIDRAGKKYKQLYQDLATIKAALFRFDEAATSHLISVAAKTEREKAVAEVKLHKARNQALGDLLRRVGSRKGHAVNFSGLLREDRPNTVEFRQHAGTLDAEEMRWWVRFCLSLVQLANRYAVSKTECPIRDWTDEISLDPLFALMDFPEEGRQYYAEKMAAFPAVEPPQGVFVEADELDISIWEEDRAMARLEAELVKSSGTHLDTAWT